MLLHPPAAGAGSRRCARTVASSHGRRPLHHFSNSINAPPRTGTHATAADEKRHAGLLDIQRAVAVDHRGDLTQLSARPTGLGVRYPVEPVSRRLRVAVDIDEVLGRFLFALNLFCKEHHDMTYAVNDYWIYEFAKIWNCTTDRSNHIVHEFFKSQHFNDGIPVVPGAFETLLRLRASCDLVVVTSRQYAIQDATLEWIERHYPGIFQNVYFGNHFALHGTSRKKSEICKSIGAHVLIDDNPTYALDCASEGLQVLLYDWDGSYPWSKLPATASRDNIQVVHNWSQVEVCLMDMALQQQHHT